MRFAPPSWNRGKRGALRILYIVFNDHGIGVLAATYRKGDVADISPTEKKSLKYHIENIKRHLERPLTKRK